MTSTSDSIKAILRLKAVSECTGLAQSTIYKKVREGTFPNKIKLGPRATGWLAHEVENWINDQIIASAGDKN